MPWFMYVYFIGLPLLPLILWVLSGVKVGDKWMGAGSDHKDAP